MSDPQLDNPYAPSMERPEGLVEPQSALEKDWVEILWQSAPAIWIGGTACALAILWWFTPFT